MDFVACLSSYFLRLCQCLVMLHGSRANMIFMENKETILSSIAVVIDFIGGIIQS